MADKIIQLKNNILDKIKTKSDTFVKNNFSSDIKRKVLLGKIADFFVNILKYFLMYGLCFVILYPIIQQLAIAVRPPMDLNDPSVVWFPSQFSMDNITIAVIVLDYWKAFFTTLTLAGGVCILTVIATSLAGYVFAKINFFGKKVLFGIVILLIIVPQSTIELPLKILFKEYGILGDPIVLYIMAFACIGLRSGVFIFLFRQFFNNIPHELEEAAYVDGATPLQVFYKIMLPNAKGGILTVGILSFVWQWNDSYLTQTFVTNLNSNLSTLVTRMLGLRFGITSAIKQAGVWELVGQDVMKNPLFESMILNTCGILIMLPLIIMYLVLQKKLFTEGIESSGIVG